MSDETCVFYEAWVGECNNEVSDETELPLCDEHRGRLCSMCGGTATTQCGAAGALVCGRPLCEECKCPQHSEFGHKAPRDLDLDVEDDDEIEDDIISDLVSGDERQRTAIGHVNGFDITLYKRKRSMSRYDWQVVARTETDNAPSSPKLFDDASEADQYFDQLVEKYDLVEGVRETLVDGIREMLGDDINE